MFRRSTLVWCSPAAAQTLTAWLSRLAEQADALPLVGNSASSSSPSPLTSSTPTAPNTVAAQLFIEIEDVATHANALRETDTLFTILQSVLQKSYFPADASTWARLAGQLLPYAGIEASSVLHYPGRCDGAVRRDGHVNGSAPSWRADTASSLFSSSSSSSPPHLPYRVPVTREMLLLTGGVVPLSARVPCGDGRVVALFLDNFVRFVRIRVSSPAANSQTAAWTEVQPDVLQAVRSVSKAVLSALSLNAATLQWEVLLPSLLEYLRLLHELDLRSATAALVRDPQKPIEVDADGEADVDEEEDQETGGSSASGAAAATGSSSSSSGSSGLSSQRVRFLQRMTEGLSHHALAHGARGARVVLYYLSDYFADVGENLRSADELSDVPSEVKQQLYWMQQRSLIALTRSCMRAIYLHYTPESAMESTGGRDFASGSSATASHLASYLSRDLVLASPMHVKIESLYDQIDVVFQENTNANNPLRVDEALVANLKDIHTLALLRALRLEEDAPDAYLRRALEVVDRVPASMAIEGELIAGKVRLLDLDSDTVDEEGRTAVYNDLLTSLRSLVEMRPRFAQHDGAGHSAAVERGAEEGTDGGADGDEGDEAASVRLDAVTQGILQRAHIDVITAFCASHKDEWSNEAYNILVTHKYHGVKITKELILPVLRVFSRRGDCRAFNLVDLCVLYSNESVDMNTIALLFRTCAAAGDHFRARTFLQLLNEIIPGFLVKCPSSVKESLQELKLLDAPPRHLFVSAEDDLVQSALGTEAGAVQRLPDMA